MMINLSYQLEVLKKVLYNGYLKKINKFLINIKKRMNNKLNKKTRINNINLKHNRLNRRSKKDRKDNFNLKKIVEINLWQLNHFKDK